MLSNFWKIKNKKCRKFNKITKTTTHLSNPWRLSVNTLAVAWSLFTNGWHVTTAANLWSHWSRGILLTSWFPPLSTDGSSTAHDWWDHWLAAAATCCLLVHKDQSYHQSFNAAWPWDWSEEQKVFFVCYFIALAVFFQRFNTSLMTEYLLPATRTSSILKRLSRLESPFSYALWMN